MVRHRINTLKDLETIPAHQGIEIDLRSQGNDIILQHDPFKNGEQFEDLLAQYRHSLLILNTKEDGLEDRTLSLLEKHKISAYFFLDLSLPATVKLARRKIRNFAVRFSEYEPLEACLAFQDMAEWVWIDCFNQLPLDSKNYAILKKHFKLCLVSPELQNRPQEEIISFKQSTAKFELDAVCTKYPELWKK